MVVSGDPLVGFVDTLGTVLGGMSLERHVDERDEEQLRTIGRGPENGNRV